MSAHAPQLLVSISTSSPTLSRSKSARGIEPFFITIEASVTGTEDNQPITAYVTDTLLHPETGREALEYRGFVFTDTSTNEPAARLRLIFCNSYPESMFKVCPAAYKNFAEIPSSGGGKGPYRLSYDFDNTKYPDFLDPTLGFTAGREYRVTLGEKMSTLGWWRVGGKDHVLTEGQRQGTRVNVKQNNPPLQMAVSGETKFHVVE